MTVRDTKVLRRRRPKRGWKAFRRNRLAVVGSLILIAIILSAGIGPIVLGVDSLAVDVTIMENPPSSDHLLGTDALGRDVLARLLEGGRVSLLVGLGAVTIFTLIGTVVGLVSGYYGGWIDNLLQRLTEVVMTFPWVVLIAIGIMLTGRGAINLAVLIGLFGWPGVARLVRAEVLALREELFVSAAKIGGVSNKAIIIRHMLPGVLGAVSVAATLGVAFAILLESGMSFLGLGVPPPVPTWGGMIQESVSLRVLESKPWLWIPPAAAIALTVLSINFVGEGLRDAIDPKSIGK